MRINASLAFWHFLIFIVVWRQILKINRVQAALHRVCHGCLAPALQWYSLYFAGILILMVYSIYELLSEYDLLPADEISARLNATYHLPQNHGVFESPFQEFGEKLAVEPWLRWLNLASQFAVIPVVVIAMVHVSKLLVLKSKRLAEQDPEWRSMPWKPPAGMNWLLLVVTMPVMFCMCSMRANCRILAIMTGKAAGHATMEWPRVQTIEFAMYTSDLRLAAFFQFSTVYAFARICGSILSERAIFQGEAAGRDAAEYTIIIKAAGFLGVWAFVAVGMARCLFSFALAEVMQFEAYETLAVKLQDTAFQQVSTVFCGLTVLCVINMIIICRTSIITDKLHNANQKFMGTRLLLLAGDIQAKVVAAFTVGKAIHTQALIHAKRFGIPMDKWTFSDEQAHLFHLSLLNFECLAVVTYNLIAWYNLDLQDSGLTSFKPASFAPLPDAEGSPELPTLLASKRASGGGGFLDAGGAPEKQELLQHTLDI